MIHVLNNRKKDSTEENMLVMTEDDGVKLLLHGDKRDHIFLDIEGELKLLDILVTHLKERLK